MPPGLLRSRVLAAVVCAAAAATLAAPPWAGPALAAAARAPGAPDLFDRPALTPGASPGDIDLADLDGDGRDDVVAASHAQVRQVSVSLSRDVFFEPSVRYPLSGGHMGEIAVGDFDGDGAHDVATTEPSEDFTGPAPVWVLRGRGDGTLHEPVLMFFVNGGRRLAVGDFDGDGFDDLASGGDELAVAFGGADGVRTRTQVHAQAVAAAASGDLDGDGRDDLVVVLDDGTVQVRQSRAGRSFELAGTVALDPRQMPAVLTTEHLDSDAAAEILLVGADGVASVFDGPSLRPAATPVQTSLFQPAAAAAGDVDRDGTPDLIVGGPDGLVVVRSSDGKRMRTVLEGMVADLAVTDATGDGSADVLASVPSQHAVVIVEDRGAGLPQPPPQFGVGAYFPVGVSEIPASQLPGDANGDGLTDLFVLNMGGGGLGLFGEGVSVLIADGKGGFLPEVRLPNTPVRIETMGVGDFNGDGTTDVAVGDYRASGLFVHLSNGDGSYAEAIFTPAGGIPAAVTAGDFNGDGRTDLFVTGHGMFTPSFLQVLLGTGTGVFVPRPVSTLPDASLSLYADVSPGDFDGDGHLDVVMGAWRGLGSDPDNPTTSSGYRIQLLRGDGQGDLARVAEISYDRPTSGTLAAGDVLGDARAEIIVPRKTEDRFLVLGVQDGEIVERASVPAFEYPMGASVADIDGDGRNDLLGSHGPNVVSVTEVTPAGTFAPPTAYASGKQVTRPVAVRLTPGARPSLALPGGSSVTVLSPRG